MHSSNIHRPLTRVYTYTHGTHEDTHNRSQPAWMYWCLVEEGKRKLYANFYPLALVAMLWRYVNCRSNMWNTVFVINDWMVLHFNVSNGMCVCMYCVMCNDCGCRWATIHSKILNNFIAKYELKHRPTMVPCYMLFCILYFFFFFFRLLFSSLNTYLMVKEGDGNRLSNDTDREKREWIMRARTPYTHTHHIYCLLLCACIKQHIDMAIVVSTDQLSGCVAIIRSCNLTLSLVCNAQMVEYCFRRLFHIKIAKGDVHHGTSSRTAEKRKKICVCVHECDAISWASGGGGTSGYSQSLKTEFVLNAVFRLLKFQPELPNALLGNRWKCEQHTTTIILVDFQYFLVVDSKKFPKIPTFDRKSHQNWVVIERLIDREQSNSIPRWW